LVTSRRLTFSLAAMLASLPAAASAQTLPKPPVRGPKPAPGLVLPEAELRARVIAPSASGPWTLRLENDGPQWLRVPADLRLLHLTVDDTTTVGRRQVVKAVKCALPAPLRVTTFPEPRAVLLGPGDAYVETFDPRLFCFGKEGKALAGGALVRATYGFEGGTAKKEEAPFAVEGTLFPATTQPRKQLTVPSLVLSWLAPEVEAREAHVDPPDPAAPPPVELPALSGGARDAAPAPPPMASEPKIPLDENAPRLEVTTGAFADVGNGRALSATVTVTNVGHRVAIAAIRSRMIAFHVEGPDGPLHCPHEVRTNMPREAFQTLKPGASTSVTMLVVEQCGRDLFPRPGLYELTPTLHLDDGGTHLGLGAMTGSFRAVQPMLIRVAEGSEPFNRHKPHVTRAPRPDGDIPGAALPLVPKPQTPAIEPPPSTPH
jgi:hypothetical protein